MMATLSCHAHRASIMHFTGDPRILGEQACQYFEDGLLVIDQGRVVACGPFEALRESFDSVPTTTHTDTLIAPGFVDTHIHFPQTGVIASYGTDLLNWLNTYTFPYEAKFADSDYAQSQAMFFLDYLLTAGTTTALVFASSHRQSVDALFAESHRRQLRLITGKLLMDRGAPKNLLDTVIAGRDESRALIRQWHGRGRLGYAVTPRFAPTSTPAQLSMAGELLVEFPDVLMQTHLSENLNELALVKELFPQSCHYLDVYEQHGLVGERSVFAHAIHLGEDEWTRLAHANCALSHCPTSNLFLGSGLFNACEANKRGIRLGFGTDVGGGNSYSMLRVMEEAYKVARLRGGNLTPWQLWYHATLGGAVALHCDDAIGNFAIGKEADFIALDLAATPLIRRRLKQSHTLSDKLFSIAMLGSEAAIVRQTWILGEPTTADNGVCRGSETHSH